MSDKIQELRDLFAAHALSILADPQCGGGVDGIASYAWKMSDAMIKERFAKEAQWREEEIMRRTQCRIDVGEGYRQLDLDERVQDGDEVLFPICDYTWKKCVGTGVRVRDIGMIVRRKVAP